ncbi:serine dehydratase subunit alpha family protein [Veillonella caviae]|uniref:L-cysteine desulfidase family protein n=1 Tax=Veillonella caviae TaxID=248316 RepID=UPI0023A8BC3B|nr:L-serine ammonia-lyase, iron-sulfur-dependent, subunit alpha [Veillonella caviae]MCI5708969.1 L-serine ammonia-lyase, iron-sulfur-dependent, subunit alpha [Veillonella caviae]MCI7693249.1 L-serine ammonia-lyase, iron-sulfur-dependent, subunit alpha [Veillonella caviae]MDD7290910.1 L-serine ammonia-lyase, iron-sulfur-dependent, subunit alpha [Veillonella caviae]MDY4746640.1 L-serine ammonia-lyase, iron-sulfur-dependent, subunit alpha [Veillonella caviae]MDY5253937.1 L-serine ammonia-lyase, i
MDYISLLQAEMKPAFGCTEPIALAYAAAKAASILDEFPNHIHARCSANIIKNVKSVVIPNSGGRKGLAAATVLGAIVGHPERELEVLEAATDEDRRWLGNLLDANFCSVELVEGVDNLYIEITAESDEQRAVVRIEGDHTHITYVELDGQVIYAADALIKQSQDTCPMTFESIYAFAKTGDVSGIIPQIQQQIAYNSAISNEGLNNDYGANIGQLLLVDDDNPSFETKCKARAAAGSDARMSGCPLPVVICSGSGNQGLTVSMPIITAAEELQKSDEELYRALVFANLLTLYVKSGIGKLSAYCGVVSAGIVSVTGIAFLKGESKDIIEQTLVNGLVSLSGIVCDGAKPSCAGKIAISLDGAFMGYKQAKMNKSYAKGDGLVAMSVDDTIKSIGVVAQGMKETDIVILNEMLKH